MVDSASEIPWHLSFSTRKLRTAWDTLRLSETIDHAYRNVPHYRDLWNREGLSPSAFETIRDISLFPPTEKSSVASDPKAFISEADSPEVIYDTSGTTGRRLPVYSNTTEDRELAKLLAVRSAGVVAPKLVLRILPPPRRLGAHLTGLSMRSIGQLRLPVLPGYDVSVWSDSIDQVANVIFEDYLVGMKSVRIDLIHATPPPLFFYITEQLVARSVDPALAGIHDILLTGGFITKHVRQSLSSIWNARVSGSYSCTEIKGDAPECPVDPSVFHPSPSVFAEVLDPHTLKHVPHGSHGVVALTGLYPYQRVMPMIRYLTGDIAQFVNGPCACGAPTVGLRLVGRMGHVVDLSDVVGFRYFLGSKTLLDAIGDSPHIPAFPYPRMSVTRHVSSGSSLKLVLEFEATCPRAMNVEAEEERIRFNLLGLDHFVQEAVESGNVDLRVSLVEKGALINYFRLYPGR